MVPTITIAVQEWKERQDKKNRNHNYKITPGPQSDSDNYRHKGQIRNMAWRQTSLLSLRGWVYVLLVRVSSRIWFPVAPPASQRPHQEKLSRRKKKKEERKKILIHPNRHTCPFPVYYAAMILLQRLPLQWNTICFQLSPISFFFSSSLKGQAFFFSFFFFAEPKSAAAPINLLNPDGSPECFRSLRFRINLQPQEKRRGNITILFRHFEMVSVTFRNRVHAAAKLWPALTNAEGSALFIKRLVGYHSGKRRLFIRRWANWGLIKTILV